MVQLNPVEEGSCQKDPTDQDHKTHQMTLLIRLYTIKRSSTSWHQDNSQHFATLANVMYSYHHPKGQMIKNKRLKIKTKDLNGNDQEQKSQANERRSNTGATEKPQRYVDMILKLNSMS